ncbi:MAG: hypothetical protein WBE42_20655 [Pseudolabrys sp.]
MSDDTTKPIGYDTLREAVAVIIEHEAARARARPNSDRGKLSLPKLVNSEPHKRSLVR